MKGIIFTEFLELVEDKFGLGMVDKIISQSELDSGGIYTSVGTYEFSEMLQLISHLSNNTDISVDDLLMVYSEHLFSVLVKTHPDLVKHYKDPMDLLASIENHIHVEVQKIYPEAQLPTFELEERTEEKMVMVYKSERALYMLGKGLMLETFKLFDVPVTIDYEKLNDKGTEVRFIVNKQ
ncbi:heme NO-binding domain-containing protein [Psychroserpens sp.]|uniref:heme NO-binding domain-containing protein n=1 Tax=Psychroserpens sp. TaxID=2020870 RepID=UPI001B15B587|nr:heme NO-binding domain-containing protein [Psychroserpens sp.]MBO6605700.1 heme NO-binding domain-containing protein [Psychroserpens sp.]MBO6630435.1 heme NO-binding domain-containing protein [Psychroserpens sp.]MBO6652929.1 heme NO-binding domain-containing protein [Psychroserpens sp.]MBO6681299.1 heme NO-binding domain-containing protein [Psychroserpens sp.]MBO6749074.1 heme NO-binding domain-containing protein [Psychroserpens sp.]